MKYTVPPGNQKSGERKSNEWGYLLILLPALYDKLPMGEGCVFLSLMDSSFCANHCLMPHICQVYHNVYLSPLTYSLTTVYKNWFVWQVHREILSKTKSDQQFKISLLDLRSIYFLQRLPFSNGFWRITILFFFFSKTIVFVL